MKPSGQSRRKRWEDLLVHLRGTLLFRKDPYWNFKELLELEDRLGLCSTWFMLEKTRLDNSRYYFHQPRIRKLIAQLEEAGHEIGIHGTLESSTSASSATEGLLALEAITGNPVRGNRQHYLKYQHPETTRIIANSSLEYDASLGFAEHIGFRNSYAKPFRLYDFENEQAYSTWELPLAAMDVSMTDYMGLSPEGIQEALGRLLGEIKKFGGMLGLLWHNCRLDEEETPGIQTAYTRILEKILDEGLEPRTGSQVLESLRSYGA
jgi:peptidoglycan/xylan/chitin deacetylase (PgdA/CDA1 family)